MLTIFAAGPELPGWFCWGVPIVGLLFAVGALRLFDRVAGRGPKGRQ